jgi:N-sulfoglucosamine sulfohydrolase
MFSKSLLVSLATPTWLFSGTFFWSVPTHAAEKPSAQKPNILFVIADDWGGGHAGAYGCRWINTPHFDRIAREGILFLNAYTPTAKCAPSRSAILTGKNPWQLDAAANHWCFFPPAAAIFPEALEKAGYTYASTGKVWGPGVALNALGAPRNLSGKQYSKRQGRPKTTGISPNDYSANFREFLSETPTTQPWFFWLGALEPHRDYEKDSGMRTAGKQLRDIDRVPGYWPDTETVRGDMLDYALEVEHFDRHLGLVLEALEHANQLENTLIVVTSDNGMPFPRVKGNTYEASNHLPLAVRWPGGIETPGRIVTDYVSFVDLAPTFLEAAGALSTTARTAPGRSLRDVFEGGKSGRNSPQRDHVLVGRERNDVGRPGDVGYPVRGLVREGWVYLENSEPNRWPACNPETGYLDTDTSPTKSLILENHRSDPAAPHWALSFGMRPERELYQLSSDPDCIQNLASDPAQRPRMETLRAELWQELKAQGDLRALGRGAEYDAFPSADKANRNFYERYMAGETLHPGWVAPTDFEKLPKK